MTRIAILLLLCTTTAFGQKNKTRSQPEKDFETFWTTFKNHYAFFQLKGVNWDSTYRKYRPLVTKKTGEKQLVSLLQQMVKPLQDGHITISKGEDMLYKFSKPSHFRQEFKGQEKQFWQTVFTTLEANGFAKPVGVGPVFRDEHLYYVSQTPQTGYVRITRCFATPESLFDDNKEVEDTRLMLRLFDSLLNKMQNTSALVIDMRANGGGHGGLELASRFVKAKTLTHYKAVKQKGGYKTFSALQPQYISPNKGTQYLKRVILLTNDKTASSAEDFTISLYQQNNVTTIGTNTSGMLSDMFSGELSNNISFTLSNQVYYSTTKEILEDKGVPVNYTIQNTRQDIDKQNDPVLTKALEILK